MITFFRMIRLWQLRIKWRLALYRLLDRQLQEAAGLLSGQTEGGA